MFLKINKSRKSVVSYEPTFSSYFNHNPGEDVCIAVVCGDDTKVVIIFSSTNSRDLNLSTLDYFKGNTFDPDTDFDDDYDVVMFEV